MAGRSVLDTLDLCTTTTVSDSATQGIGWLSPRISFSTGIVDKSATPVREAEARKEDREDRALDFEFCMGSSSLDDPVSGGCMLPADELFQKGRFRPHPDKVFSGPLDTMKAPPQAQRQYVSAGVSKSGPLASFPGEERAFPRFSGPLEMRGPGSPPPLRFSGPLSGGSAVPADAAAKPKLQAWEKVIGLLRRARSDSHRDRLCSDREQTVPASRKQCSSSMPKKENPGSAASSLRLIFRRNSSIDKTTAKSAVASDGCPSHVKSSLPPSEPLPAWSPPHPAAFFPSSSKPAGLAALHVASPVYPTSATERDGEADMWTSSATEVDLRPGSTREVWRMHETESSLEITFDKPGDVVKKKVLGPGPTTTGSNSSRIVLKNLERCSNPVSKGAKGGQEQQLRALRTREIRRSPERLASYTSSVRVTPVLNVPVCIAPTMRSSKAAKGRLAGLRSLLSFKKEKEERTFADPAIVA